MEVTFVTICLLKEIYYFYAAAGHGFAWISPGRMTRRSHHRGHICRYSCYTTVDGLWVSNTVASVLCKDLSQGFPTRPEFTARSLKANLYYRLYSAENCIVLWQIMLLFSLLPTLPQSQASSGSGAAGKAHLNAEQQVCCILAGVTSHPPEPLKEVSDPYACLQASFKWEKGKGELSCASTACLR